MKTDFSRAETNFSSQYIWYITKQTNSFHMLQKIDSNALSYKHMLSTTFLEDITEGTL